MKPWMAAAMSGSPTLVTQTFTSSQSVTIPFGVSKLETLQGTGAPGSSTSTAEQIRSVVEVTYRTDTSTGTGNVTWANFAGLHTAVANDANADGYASFTAYVVDVWPDGTNSFYTYNDVIDGAIPGTVTANTTGAWKSSGAITGSGTSRVIYQYSTGATTGASSSAFGYTFPGGTGGPATPVNQTNVPVTAGATYSITVPAGGSVTITYYK